MFFTVTYSWIQGTESVGESDGSVEVCLQRTGVSTPKTVGKFDCTACVRVKYVVHVKHPTHPNNVEMLSRNTHENNIETL